MLLPKSVLITGSNRGVGLKLVKHFLKLPTPPSHVFAACRSPDSAHVSTFFSFSTLSYHLFKMIFLRFIIQYKIKYVVYKKMCKLKVNI